MATPLDLAREALASQISQCWTRSGVGLADHDRDCEHCRLAREALTSLRALSRPDPRDLALRNVLGLASQMRQRGARDTDVPHLIRFCHEAGVANSILRGAQPDPRIAAAEEMARATAWHWMWTHGHEQSGWMCVRRLEIARDRLLRALDRYFAACSGESEGTNAAPKGEGR